MDKEVQNNLGYHYTSVESFIKMIDGIENNNIIFHASSIFSLNDPTEMKYGYEKIMKILPEIEEELGINDDTYKLSLLWEKDSQRAPQDWHTHHLTKMKNGFIHSFVLSYSRCRDNLQMWRMYGNDGKGVSLGLDLRFYSQKRQTEEEPFLDYTHIDLDKPHSIDVEYDKMTTQSTPYYLVKSEYKDYWKSVQSFTDEEDILSKQVNAVTMMMMVAAPFIKHGAYSYERESRIINLHENIHSIKFKNNNSSRVIPYIEVPIPVSSLKEVIVGPCSELNSSFINIKLLQKGIKNVEIVPSVVPYRN